MTTTSYNIINLSDANELSVEESYHDAVWVINKLEYALISNLALKELHAFWFEQWNFVSDDKWVRLAYQKVCKKVEMSKLPAGFMYAPYVPIMMVTKDAPFDL